MAVLAGCYTGAALNSDPGPELSPSANNTSAALGSVDLPCDCANLVATHCASCHGPTPVGNSVSLWGHAALTAKSAVDPTKTVAERSLLRMRDTASPMPPGGGLSATDIGVFETWMKSGSPAGSCTVTDPNGPSVCTSNSHYSGGEGPDMSPGDTCVSCHAKEREAPKLGVGGTVYATAHEPTNCNGAGGAGATIVITDANNRTTTLPVSAAGNFTSTAAIAKPFKAKVVAGGKERAMAAGITDGDCNSCHTERGANGAPGRIFLP